MISSEDDSALIIETLKENGFDPEWNRVDSRPGFEASMESGWDLLVIASGWPGFEAGPVVTRARAESPDLPVIVISSPSGEAVALDLIRSGITTFVLSPGSQIASAVTRALSAVEAKREEVLSECARRERERQLRVVVDQAFDGILTLDREGAIFDANGGALALTGYDEEEMAGLSITHLLGPVRLEEPMNLTALAVKAPVVSRAILRRKDGHHLPVDISASAAGEGLMLVVLRDARQQVETERALRQRKAEFKALVENSPDVISRFDRDLRHVYISPVIERYSGVPAARFIGKTHRELGMPEDICLAFETSLRAVFATGQEQTSQFTFPSQQGQRLFQGTVVPEFGAGDEVEFALSVTHDITDIRNSEQRLEAAQRIANIGSWEKNLDTGQRIWSRELYRIMSLRQGELPEEERLMLAIPAEDRGAVDDAYRTAVESGQMQCVEHRMNFESGPERVFSVLIEPQQDENGRTFKLTGTVQDVTALRHAESSLRQSEQRLRDLIDSANDAILTLDTSGTVLEVNPAVLRLTGETAETLVGRHITHSIHPDHVGEVAQGLATVLSMGRVARIEAPLLTARGEFIQIEATASRQSRDGADAIFVIARDVTERRRADEERQALTRKIELLLESTYEGICSADRDGRCTLVNRAAAVMLGYTPAEILGQNLHELMHRSRADGSQHGAAECPISIVVRDERPVHLVDEVFCRRDGSVFPVEIFASPIYDEKKTVIGTVASFVDVSERRLLQTELERANRLTGLGRVAAMMSHEFNNVLMGIQPFAEIVTRASREPKVVEAAKRIGQSVQRGRRITEELRRFTAPVDPVRSRVDVGGWLPDCAAELARVLPFNVRLDVDVADVPMAIEADREQMSQVVSNLVLNACDAIGTRQGLITISAATFPRGAKLQQASLPADQAFIYFSVSDDGPGIATANLSRITEPFFTTKKNGTGLGLAITQQIVTLHGGHLFIESEIGVGTSVHFFLPATSQPASVTTGPEIASAPEIEGPLEVLLIEDDESVAFGLSALLQEEGVTVVVAASGEEAMRILQTMTPQVLIIDIGLPDCNGIELYARITAAHGPLPAVFSSGHTDQLDGNDFAGSAAVRILTKPYALEDLLIELEAVTREHRAALMV